MKILGIESTAHTIGFGIIDQNCKILANERHMFTTEEGGINPAEAANHHREWKEVILNQALAKANLEMKDFDLISFSASPGLSPCLREGMLFAKKLAKENKIELLGVNHPIAHIEIGRKLTKAKDPIFVYASGANTQIIGYENGKYRVYGETLDTGIGNALDTFARAMKIGFPGGPILDKMYFEGKELIELPYTVKGMDLFFSGLVTAAERKIGKVRKEDLAYSFMHNALAMLTEVTERALAHTEKKEILLGGGVAASKAFNEMLEKMCKERKAKKFTPPREVCVDNGVMIAWLGYLMNKSGVKQKIEEIDFNPKERADQVEITWI